MAVGLHLNLPETCREVRRRQTLERKAAFLHQIRSGHVGREVDEVGEQTLSFAEVKALATGDPLIMERAGIEGELARLGRLRRAHHDDQGRLARTHDSAQARAERQHELAVACERALSVRQDTWGERFRMVIDGRQYTERATAGEALLGRVGDAVRQHSGGGRGGREIGRLGGFPLWVQVRPVVGEPEAELVLEGVPRSGVPVAVGASAGMSRSGLVVQLENRIRALDETRTGALEDALEARQEADRAQGRMGQPFEHEPRLVALRQRLAEIDEVLAPEEGLGPARDSASTAQAGELGAQDEGPRAWARRALAREVAPAHRDRDQGRQNGREL